MSPLRSLVVIALSGCLVGATDVAGQNRIQLEQVDSDCRIMLEEKITLEGDPVQLPDVIAATDDRIYLVPLYATYEIGEFDATGKHVGTLGGEGGGPGEFRRIVMIQPRGDSIYVFDSDLFQVTVLEGGSVVRTFARGLDAGPSRLGAVALGDSAWIMVGYSARNPDNSLHLVRSGEVVRSFGEPSGRPRRRQVWIRRGVEGNIWALYGERYLLREYRASDLTVGREAVADADWMDMDPEPMYPTSHPFDFFPLDADRFLIAGRVLAEDFEIPDNATLSDLRAIHPTSTKHTVLEVVDLRDGTRSCTTHVHHFPVGFVGPGWYTTVEQNEVGESSVTLWRWRIQNPSG